MATGPIKPSQQSPLVGATAAETAKKTDRSTQAESKQAESKSERAAPAKGQGYDVQISEQAKTKADLQKRLLEAARKQPDIREDKVAALKGQIAAGTYQIDTGKIADGMLREAIREHLALNDD